jgi:23S rRNA (cytidine1920-2'-O)/16S rRNA (cytidine1409-2'-O)-methyltransferase
MTRRRLDAELVRRGLVASRTEAHQAVAERRVLVAGAVAEKPGRLVADAEAVVLEGPPTRRYVSRGGEKLEAALDAFAIDPDGRTCLDVGSSTGGFTDCLLQRGAARVFCVDAGRGQLHDRLRRDPRVVVMERTNARYLEPSDLNAEPTLATVDVSFISATKVTPAVRRATAADADVVVLVKPQFEAGRGHVPPGGVIRDPVVRESARDRALDAFAEQGFAMEGLIESPITGADGNVEFLAHLRR